MVQLSPFTAKQLSTEELDDLFKASQLGSCRSSKRRENTCKKPCLKTKAEVSGHGTLKIVKNNFLIQTMKELSWALFLPVIFLNEEGTF